MSIGGVHAWMPLYIGDYKRDTGHLTTTEHGAYLLLLMAAWPNDGALPNDQTKLARLAGLSVTAWLKVAPEVMPYFQLTDGVWRSKRLDEEIARAKKYVDSRRRGAKARWAKQDAHADAYALHTDERSILPAGDCGGGCLDSPRKKDSGLGESLPTVRLVHSKGGPDD